MKGKFKEVTAQVWIVQNGKKIGRGSKRHRIYRNSENSGVIIDDGREVRRNSSGEWCYEVR